MLTYALDNLQEGSMYSHLYRCIKEDIAAGRIAAGEKLPSKRALAKNLGVSIITVENAYAQLVVEGYIYSKPKSGYYAAQFTAPAAKPFHPSASETVTTTPPDYFVDFAASSVDADGFPYNTWARLLRHTLTAADEHALLADSSAGGVLTLRRAIANHLYQFRGVAASPEQIIIGAGTQVLYNLIVQLLGRSHVYALEDPGYPQLSQIYRANGVFCRHLPMDGAGIRADVLEASDADILHITPSHQFPTGIVMPASRRSELLHWAAESSNRYIIEDDYDCEFRLAGRPIPPLASIDTQEKVIYINTFSKTLAPTFRISYMVLPRHLTRIFYDKLGFYACTVSNFEQFTLAKFIEDGHLERHINRMRTAYRTKRDKVLTYLSQSPLAPALKIEGADSGLHFLLHIDTAASDSQLLKAIREQNINVNFLSRYYQQPISDASHTMLINYAGIPEDRLFEGLQGLLTALENYCK